MPHLHVPHLPKVHIPHFQIPHLHVPRVTIPQLFGSTEQEPEKTFHSLEPTEQAPVSSEEEAEPTEEEAEQQSEPSPIDSEAAPAVDVTDVFRASLTSGARISPQTSWPYLQLCSAQHNALHPQPCLHTAVCTNVAARRAAIAAQWPDTYRRAVQPVLQQW